MPGFKTIKKAPGKKLETISTEGLKYVLVEKGTHVALKEGQTKEQAIELYNLNKNKKN